MNSDLFTNINYEDFYLHFKEHDADMSVAAVPYDVNIPLGILNLDGRNITGLSEKPHFGYYANAGIYLIRCSVLDLIPEDIMFHSTDLIEALIAAERKVIRFPIGGMWIDIGTPQEYQKAKDLVKKEHKKRILRILTITVLHGKIHLVKLFESLTIFLLKYFY